MEELGLTATLNEENFASIWKSVRGFQAIADDDEPFQRQSSMELKKGESGQNGSAKSSSNNNYKSNGGGKNKNKRK